MHVPIRLDPRGLRDAGTRVSGDRKVRATFAAPMLTAALCALLAAGPAVAQTYDDLDKAVPDLARRLVSEAGLTAQRVLVTPHDFFEEHSGRRLLLSETLSKRFGSELSGYGVVVVLDAANADEMRVLRGEWSPREEGGVDLSVSIRHRVGEDHVSRPVRGHVRHVAPDRLRSDLPFLGRHLVRALERRVRDRRERRVRVGDFTVIGTESGQDHVRRFLEAFWLRPAFAGSRLFQLTSASPEGGGSDGEVRVTVFVSSAAVSVSVEVWDTGSATQVSAATVEVPRELLRDVLDGDGDPPPPPPVTGNEVEGGSDEREVGDAPRTQAGRQVGERFRDCEMCPEMVVVPAGSYEMGSPEWEAVRSDAEGPVHRVTIAAPIAVGVYEVTFAEWDACVAEGGCYGYRPDDNGWGRGSRPVADVSWNDVRGYVGWLSRKTRKTYRLPSESEWEYVARAGTTTPYHFGGSVSPEQVNYNGSVHRKTLPVGSYPANGFGLYDVHGNVWEWVQDCWNASYAGAPVDGSAWESGDCGLRVLRGGSWLDEPRRVRSAYRTRNDGGFRLNLVGFRLMQD